jgi:hypothetical protein
MQTQLRINFDKRCLWKYSDENRAINASGLVYNAPEKDIGNTVLVLEIFSKYSELILLGEPIISTYQKPIDLL